MPKDFAQLLQLVRFEAVEATASGDTEILPASADQRIVIMGFVLIAASPVIVRFNDTAGNSMSGPMSFPADGGAAPSSEFGLFWTAPGEGVNLNLSGAVTVGGAVTYYRRDEY